MSGRRNKIPNEQSDADLSPLTAYVTRRRLLVAASATTICAGCGFKSTPQDAPLLWGDGLHDDTVALQAFFNGRQVNLADSTIIAVFEDGEARLSGGFFLISEEIQVPRFAQFRNSVFMSRALDALGSLRGPMMRTKGSKLN